MTDYVDSALFVYTENTKYLSDDLQNNLFAAQVVPVELDCLLKNTQAILEDVSHVVVAWVLDEIKTIR